MDQSIQPSEGGIVPPSLPVVPKRRWGKTILYTIGGLVLVAGFILTLPFTLTLIYKDGPPPDDSDLRLSVVNVPDNENAYFDLTKAWYEDPFSIKEAMRIMVDEEPWLWNENLWDEKAAEAEVAGNARALAVFAAAAAKPKFQDPVFADPKWYIHEIPPSSEISTVSAFYALYLARQGKDKEAMEAAFLPVRIVEKIENSQARASFLFQNGISMKRVGLGTARQILASSTLSNADLRQYVQELEQYEKNDDDLTLAFKVAYHQLTQIVEDPEVAPNVNYFFEPNKTKALFIGDKELVQRAYVTCDNKIIPLSGRPSWLEGHTTENSYGKNLSDTIISQFSIFAVENKCYEDMLVTVTKTMFAMKAYKNDMGQLPPTLDVLVPKYLSSVPLDPYGGKPLKYSQEKKLIYSIGSDMQDSGGNDSGNWLLRADQTFMINF
jgi:hypothetical protein